jgi:hypothetical protein
VHIISDPLEDTPEHEYNFDQHGKYQHHTVATHTIVPEDEFLDSIECVDFDDLVDDFMDLLHPESVSVIYNVNLTDVAKVKQHFKLLRSLFGWAPIDTIQHTIDVTTQFARGRVSDTPKQHLRSRFSE